MLPIPSKQELSIQREALLDISVQCFPDYKNLANCVQKNQLFKNCSSQVKEYHICLHGGLGNSKVESVRNLSKQFTYNELLLSFEAFDNVLIASPRPSFLTSCLSKIIIFNHMNEYQWFSNPKTQPKALKYFHRMMVCQLNVSKKPKQLEQWNLCYDHEFGQSRFYSQEEFREKYDRCVAVLE